MCGYDPFYWYDLQLDREYEAHQAGFDCWEDYQEAKEDDKANWDYDNWKENYRD